MPEKIGIFFFFLVFFFVVFFLVVSWRVLLARGRHEGAVDSPGL